MKFAMPKVILTCAALASICVHNVRLPERNRQRTLNNPTASTVWKLTNTDAGPYEFRFQSGHRHEQRGSPAYPGAAS